MNDNRISTMAAWGEHIPLKCKQCGALFHTKNIGRIGDRTIFRGSFGLDKELEMKAI